MDLRITHYNNFFKIRGILNRNNLHIFREEFRHIFDKVSNLTISIEDIESMDRFGVNALAELHKEAIVKNKKLAIIGSGCKDLYDHFMSEATAA